MTIAFTADSFLFPVYRARATVYKKDHCVADGRSWLAPNRRSCAAPVFAAPRNTILDVAQSGAAAPPCQENELDFNMKNVVGSYSRRVADESRRNVETRPIVAGAADAALAG